jgi:hypothetical protein
MYIFKNFPGENPRPKGRPRLTRRGGASNAGRDGGEEGEGERERLETPQNLYAAYAHGLIIIFANRCNETFNE